MNKAPKRSASECYTPSSGPIGIYLYRKLLQIMIVRDVTPYSLAQTHHPLETNSRIAYMASRWGKRFLRNVSTIYQTIRRHMPDDRHTNASCRKDLKSCNLQYTSTIKLYRVSFQFQKWSLRNAGYAGANVGSQVPMALIVESAVL
jgi:hypothetical protein